MLVLRTSLASPFGRKVRIAIDVVGLTGQVEVTAADTNDAGDSLREQNPLGKIPILLLENGEAVFDSPVIIEWLNERDGRGILIPSGPGRIGVLRTQALADGLMDAALLQVYEARYRPPTHHVESWLAYQRGKVERALAFLEKNPPTRHDAPDIGEITLAAALGYLDFRFGGKWRTTHPALVAWLADFAARTPAFERTTPR
jgi:glutathione S-transferase